MLPSICPLLDYPLRIRLEFAFHDPHGPTHMNRFQFSAITKASNRTHTNTQGNRDLLQAKILFKFWALVALLWHHSSPESVHLRRLSLFSLALSMERLEIITM